MIASKKKLKLIQERKDVLEFMEWCLVQYKTLKSEIARDGLLEVARVYGKRSRELEKLINQET